jgi:hypothetical protein
MGRLRQEDPELEARPELHIMTLLQKSKTKQKTEY